MDLLDLSVVNLNSPYSVWNVGDYYYFRTSHGAVYKVRPLQNLPLSQFSPIYTLRRMNIFDRKMPLEVIFE